MIAALALLICFARAEEASNSNVVEITSEPEHALVLIDGKKLGRTPLHLKSGISAGSHQLRLELDGYRSFERKIPVGTVLRLNIRMKPAPTPPPPRKHAPVEPHHQAAPVAAPSPAPVHPPAPEQPPATAAWLFGAWAGISSKSITDSPPGGNYGSLTLTIGRSLSRRLSAEFGLGADFQLGIPIPASLPADASAGFSGIESFISLPVHIWINGRNRLSLLPQLGVNSHIYTYFGTDADGSIDEIGRIKANLIWTAAGLVYERFPEPGSSLGFAVRTGVRLNGGSGAIPGAIAPYAAAAVVLSLD